MGKKLQADLAVRFKKCIADSEDWLMKRILHYAKAQGYTAYTSTLEEAWRASIKGLSKPLIDTPANSFRLMGLHPHKDFSKDEYADFGVQEAVKHRERGVDLIMFLGLFKYYRQSYEDLLFYSDFTPEEVRECRTFLKRYFDRVELGFISEWTKHDCKNVNEDISRKSRAAINEKNLYLTAMESIPHAVVILDSNAAPVVMNRTAAGLFLNSEEPEMLHYGGTMPKIFPELERSAIDFMSSANEKHTYDSVFNGRVYQVTLARMKDVSGKFMGMTVILNDISDKKKTENVLAESETFRKAMMEGIDAAAVVINMETKTLEDYNGKAYKLFSCIKDGIGMTDTRPRFYEELGGRFLSIYEIADSVRGNEERILELGTGQVIPVRIFTIEVWINNERHKAVIIFDITRERILERRLWHIQHLETIGEIAKALPKRILNPIDNAKDIIGESVGMINKCINADCDFSGLREMLSNLERTFDDISSLEDIMSALATITAGDDSSAVEIDANQIVKNCILLSEGKWQGYADLELNLSENIGKLKCRPEEIGQMVLNLLLNSAYAVRKKFEGDQQKGTITVSTRYTREFFEVKVADTGIGIKKKDYKRVFDPGFSSKKVGRGTGHGLAVTYEIVVKRYGGAIEFQSREGEGTEFTVRLPL
jgi:signal transduction histidine kinase/PAS domain-containing protein